MGTIKQCPLRNIVARAKVGIGFGWAGGQNWACPLPITSSVVQSIPFDVFLEAF